MYIIDSEHFISLDTRKILAIDLAIFSSSIRQIQGKQWASWCHETVEILTPLQQSVIDPAPLHANGWSAGQLSGKNTVIQSWTRKASTLSYDTSQSQKKGYIPEQHGLSPCRHLARRRLGHQWRRRRGQWRIAFRIGLELLSKVYWGWFKRNRCCGELFWRNENSDETNAFICFHLSHSHDFLWTSWEETQVWT